MVPKIVLDIEATTAGDSVFDLVELLLVNLGLLNKAKTPPVV